MKRSSFLLVIFTALLAGICIQSCRKAEGWDEQVFDERLSGGAQTVFTEGVGAFSSAFPTMTGARLDFHDLGDAHFEVTFVDAPAPAFGGLGPIYNNNACVNCHINDGRGKPLMGNEPLTSMLFRMSIPGEDEHGGPMGVPGYGGQMQDKSVFGSNPEAGASVMWNEFPVYYDDGDSIMLRSPAWTITNAYMSFPSGYMYSPRVAPPLHGLGLLEQVSESTILSFADEDDADGDNISGKPNYSWDAKSSEMMIGRFGWKCEAPTLDQQVAGAYNEDMGITSYVLKNESSFGQTQHDPAGDDPEVPDSIFNSVVFYTRTLAVPARRDVTDPEVMMGKQIFIDAQCGSCHIPTMNTKVDVTFPEASNQRIHPYTDLLLHDMGDGLTDSRPAFDATGNEWRTPPLWGIGLTDVVNGHNNFLHDGRARNLMEAVLWHGGEAENSVEFVKSLTLPERKALLAFLNSL